MGWVSHRGMKRDWPRTKPQRKPGVAAEPHVVSVGHEITHVAKGCRVQLDSGVQGRTEAHCWSREGREKLHSQVNLQGPSLPPPT